MRTNNFKATQKTAVRAGSILLFAAVVALGQQQVNLTARPASVTLPDGSGVPMWGYTCGTAVTGSTATCANLNPAAAAAAGTVGAITVLNGGSGYTSAPTVAFSSGTAAAIANVANGQVTSITVTSGGTGYTAAPTITIAGGGGTGATAVASLGGWSPVVITVPTGQGLTINLTNNLSFTPPTTGAAVNNIPTSLVIVGQIGGGLGKGATYVASPNHTSAQANVTWPIANTGASGTPPAQGSRVQSFATEVAAVPVGSTTAPTALTWTSLRPGTYLLESGTHPSIQVPMGLYGILVVTTAPVGTTAGTAYPAVGTTAAVTYNAELPLEFSEIDPVQNNSVGTAVNTNGFNETMVWSGQPTGCGNPSSATYHQCYPPAVNYTPLYYLIDGVAFNKANAAGSLFPTAPATGLTAGTGTVLVRLVNAGLHMHVPSIVGSQTNGFNGAGTATTAVGGFSLIAEDGNVIPGVPKVQSDVFMAAGKTFDVMVNVPAATASALPVYDRELSLSGNAIDRDAGMLAYISVNSSGLPAASGAFAAAVANPDTYNSVACITGVCQPLTISDPAKGVIANDMNVYGVKVVTAPTKGALTLNANGTFTYVPNLGWSGPDTFVYQANGNGPTTTVTLGTATMEAASGIVLSPITYWANTAGYVSIKPPGVLSVDKDTAGYPLSVVVSSVAASGVTVQMDASGGFNASLATPCATSTGCTATFSYKAKNSQGTVSTASALVTLKFPPASNLAVTVKDPQGNVISDYRWIIEEDKTFYVNPNCTTSSTTAIPGCPQPTATTVPPTFGVNFHTSHMEYVAQGCVGTVSCEGGQTVFNPVTGTHVATVCDIGNGVCDTTSGRTQQTAVNPSAIALDPGCGFGTFPARTCGAGVTAPYPKRYYVSILPGDGANPFYGTSATGHGMGGAPISWNTTTNSWNPVTVLVEPTPFPPGKLSVMVFEDDFPLNGEQDAGGGIDVIATNEPGLGGFNIVLWDDMGGSGDFTGQMTYDMFNMPLSNSLAGTIDPATGLDACPVSPQITTNATSGDGSQKGITGMIVTCPKYESDGKTQSPLAGQAVVANLMPGRFSVQAYPGADRIARGEEWLQTNTLDGQHPHDAFIRIGEPSYFQEYGPAGYHVAIGFANPKIINARHAGVCNGTDLNLTAPNCTNTVKGRITDERMSRTPDQRLYSSGSRDAFYWTQCYVSLGDPDGEDFMFAKCDANGNFTLTGVPAGSWRLSIFDQWNDQLMDGLSTPVNVANGNNQTVNMGDVGVQQWQANVYTRTFIDDNKDGVYQSSELGIPFLNTTVRYRDGSMANSLLTDFTGVANFNETFPLFNWYVVEADTTRYKTTGIHTVYDAGGPADGTTCGGAYPPCGPAGTPYANMANTQDQIPLPSNLSVPGAIYCSSATCTGSSIATGVPVPSSTSNHSTGRIDPPWVVAEGWQGYSGQGNFIEFGKAPFAAATATAPAENGGIQGHVVYASTRPFDDPQMLVQTQWEPLVPHVTMNLYKEGVAADGVTPTLTLVDTTQTSSWDDWAQGFRSDGIPNMNCPGQGAATGANADLFFYTLYNQPSYLNLYNYYYSGGALTSLPYNSQYKCYDGMHNWNQLQPAPYDGMYSFPSVLGINPNGANAGKLNTSLSGGVGTPGTAGFAAANMPGTNCTICIANPDTSDPWRKGTPMLPAGKYVVEVVLPPGYELVKEEDKNILIGDNFTAPVSQEFGALANIFIMPDQASVAAAQQYPGPGYNANNAQNPTQSLGANPSTQEVPGFVEPVWPCVGEARVVPDYISLFPATATNPVGEVAPFAGATRRMCDRKEVTVTDQMAVTAKFYIFTSTHIAAKFTGVITDDFTSEFDPFAPTFGEKFSPPNMPVSVRDWAGNEISRVYSDQWGIFNGLSYSTWEVNPPNPTGYSPTMMVTCMNDKGPILDTRTTIVNASGATVPNPTLGQMITDPLFNPLYSQFCYELPFMPGQTDYMDTPVVPTAGLVGAGYNNPDCNYPTLTPAISEVDGDGIGPWVSVPGHNITITALGDQAVGNYGYSGPAATKAPFNQKTITRHYGFGAQCTSPMAGSTTCNTLSKVTIGGANATIVSWSDTSIVATVPGSVPACAIQQQTQYGGPGPNATPGQATLCGELVVTAGNGLQSVDTVTVTVRGKAPTHVAASGTIQSAIDAAAPGDLIIIDPTCTNTTGPVACTTTGATKTPSAHSEMVLMWKPVRLQGVGAASSIIDANAQPAGRLLDPWRRSVNCLFGLALNGQPYTPATGTNPYDPSGSFSCPGTGWKYASGGPNYPSMVVDRIPLEGILGWDATVNGNLAEQLQEPSLMGAYEGAGITVLAKGVNIPAGSSDLFGSGAEAAFPTGTTLLTAADCATGTGGTNPFPSNFQCNPSSIDGLGITDSSQGGGAIFVHAWAHNLQLANNRVYNNAGTLSGGMSIGQGESPEAYLNDGTVNSPGSCLSVAGLPANTQLPYCLNVNVNIHNNSITNNSSTGDELFSGTPAGAGGVSICTGADYYKFNYNWICGNMSSGDGGGVGHLGFSWNGDIEHNSFLFNQATNPSIQSNGGGLIVMGAAPDATITVNGVATECGSVTDNDCVPGLSDGTGPGLVINGNLFQGNSADAGSGGGLRLQAVNGTDVARFPSQPNLWYSVSVTNNIFTNNVAGWDGAGVSLEDSLAVTLTNNTIASNDTTASSGVLFNTLGAPLASSQSPAPACLTQNGGTASCPQPAGLVTTQNSPQLTSSFTTGAITCPPGNYQPGTSATNGSCTRISYPALYNNVFWQNRSFDITVGPLGTGTLNQQNVVTLYNAFSNTVAASQTATGACPAGSSYWDLGVRNDTSPTNHGSGFTLSPMNGVLTSASGYSNTNLSGSPAFLSQYCNGSRVPPENGGLGYQVPPGIADAVVPNPIFSLTPAATVDEGNNWVNISWGPLSMVNPVTSTPTSNVVLGNYSIGSGSSAFNHITCTNASSQSTGCVENIGTSGVTTITAPATDFFGNPRPDNGGNPHLIDAGAVELQLSAGAGAAAPAATATVTPTALNFGTVAVGTTSAAQTLNLTNSGSGILAVNLTFSSPAFSWSGGTCPTGLLANVTTLAANSSCTLGVVFKPTTTTLVNATLSLAGTSGTTSVTVTGSPVALSGQ